MYTVLMRRVPSSVQDTVAAVANEQQAIGRVMRYGQETDVTVHRLLMTRANGGVHGGKGAGGAAGDKGGKGGKGGDADGKSGGSTTVDEFLFALNTNEATIRAATNI